MRCIAHDSTRIERELKRRWLRPVFALLIVMLTVGALVTTVSRAAEYSVNNSGLAEDAEIVYASFYVSDKPGFCCDYGKPAPETGMKVKASIKTNGDVAKALYYGYGGPAQWDGFKDDEAAVVATSLVMDHYFNGNDGQGNESYKAFLAFLATKDTSESGTTYTLYTTGDASYQRLASITPTVTVTVNVTKKSGAADITDGNKCYSLEGAQYGVYDGDTKLTTLTTGKGGTATGKIKVDFEAVKRITIKETKASAGYTKDKNVYKRDGSSGSITVISSEPPVRDPVDMLICKSDSETGKKDTGDSGSVYYPQKGGSLSEAVFKVDFYGIKGADIPADGNYSGFTPLRTWYFRSDEKGQIHYSTKYLASGYEQSPLYSDPSDGAKAALPLGVLTIREVKAPDGYLLNDKLFTAQVTADGENTVVHTYVSPVVPDVIKRGDLEFCKIKGDSQHRLPNVPFMITALQEDGSGTDSGESHIIVTDANGYVSTANSFNAHADRTNANDAAWNGETIDESKLDQSAGIWFGETSEIKAERGAMPYGRYRIDELPCAANQGYKLLRGIEIEVSRNGYVIEMGTLTDSEAEIGTSASDESAGGRKTTFAREDITLVDKVRYEGLEKGTEYAVKGVLMDKETGQPVSVNGGEVTANAKFTAAGSSGTVDVRFTFDGSGLAGKDVVVFETLTRGDIVVAKHEDINDSGQTVSFLSPDMETTAKDGDTGNKYSEADDSVTIVDTVRYSGLIKGETYEIKGTLMSKTTGKPVVSDGQEVTDTVSFTPEESEGAIKLKFEFDASSLGNGDVVVFEDMTWSDELIAEHKDMNNKSQTVELREKAHVVATGDRMRSAMMPLLILMTVSAIVASLAALRRKD